MLVCVCVREFVCMCVFVSASVQVCVIARLGGLRLFLCPLASRWPNPSDSACAQTAARA